MHAMPPSAMSNRRLLICLAALGWTVRELTRRVGRHRTTVMRWASGQSPVPHDVAAWLETLVAFHARHPAPRMSAVGGAADTQLVEIKAIGPV